MNERETIWEAKGEDVIRKMLEIKNRYGIVTFRAIEMYGSDGHTLSDKMAGQCGSFVAYEINPEKEEGFRRNVPNGEFRCGDSVKMMRDMKEGEIGTYNLVSMDAPICIYGEDYCEHFEILNDTYKLLEQGEEALCVFPVVPKPYDAEKAENREWMKRRDEFYRTKSVNLDLESVYDIYDEIFSRQNLQIIDRDYVCREYRNGVDWMYEFMYVLEK